MNSLIRVCIEKDRATLLLFVVILFLGMSVYMTIPKEQNPEVKIPTTIITCFLDGVSPTDSEKLIVRPIEEKIRGVSGIKEIKGMGVENYGYLVVTFIAGYDIDKALTDLRSKIDEVIPELPNTADRPIVQEIDLSLLPILNVIIFGDIAKRQMYRISEDIEDIIISLPNVLKVENSTKPDDSVDIVIDPYILETYKIKVTDVINALHDNNMLVTAGKIQSSGYPLKLTGTLEKLPDIMNLPIIADDKSYVTLSEVAEVRSTFKEPMYKTRINGKDAAVLEVSKREGKNIIETVQHVKFAMLEGADYLPKALHVIYSFDQSENILDMLSDLENNIIFAILLVFLVVAIFMGLKSAIVISFTIPGSFLMSIMVIKYLGYTLNIVVLFSLIMSTGMLVDATVVVVEYADRQIKHGMLKREAFIKSAIEMFSPVLSSTLTTIIVFGPLLFWPGVAGEFMKYLPTTLICTLTSSMLMSMIFCPVIAVIIYTETKKTKGKDGKVEMQEEQFNSILHKVYSKLLYHILKFPRLFISIIFIILIISFLLYYMFGKGTEFFPEVEPDSALITIRSYGNFSIDERDTIVKKIEDKILHFNQEGVKVIYSKAGTFVDFNNLTTDIIGNIQLEFDNWRKRLPSLKILEKIREEFSDIPGVVIEVEKDNSGPSSGRDLQLFLASVDFNDIIDASNIMLDFLNNDIKGLKNIASSFSTPEIEWVINIDKTKAAMLGANIADIGRYIQLVSTGLVIDTYRPYFAKEEVDILLRFPEESRNINALQDMVINTLVGNVPLSSFISITPQKHIKQVNRLDGRQVIMITASTDEGVLVSDKVKEINKFINTEAWNKNVKIVYKGQIEDQDETMQFLKIAFTIAIILVVLVLIYQFNSYYYVLVIISSIVLSIAGVMIALLITNRAFSVIMCGVGIITLAGTVVNSNILLIDAYLQAVNIHKKGHEESIMYAALTRIKPILLTAGTTFLGLIPMVTGINIDFLNLDITYNAPSSQWWKQLSTTIVGGMVFATAITLFFTPCLVILRKNKNI